MLPASSAHQVRLSTKPCVDSHAAPWYKLLVTACNPCFPSSLPVSTVHASPWHSTTARRDDYRSTDAHRTQAGSPEPHVQREEVLVHQHRAPVHRVPVQQVRRRRRPLRVARPLVRRRGSRVRLGAACTELARRVCRLAWAATTPITRLERKADLARINDRRPPGLLTDSDADATSKPGCICVTRGILRLAGGCPRCASQGSWCATRRAPG